MIVQNKIMSNESKKEGESTAKDESAHKVAEHEDMVHSVNCVTNTKKKRENRGRRGDDRMHRAVTAKLLDPSLNLLEALTEGGFSFPLISYEMSLSSKTLVDSDNIHLQQRKNQLSRRLRNIRKQQIKREKDKQKQCIIQNMGYTNPSSNTDLRYSYEHRPMINSHALTNFGGMTPSSSVDPSIQTHRLMQIAALQQSNTNPSRGSFPHHQKVTCVSSRNQLILREQQLLLPKFHYFQAQGNCEEGQPQMNANQRSIFEYRPIVPGYPQKATKTFARTTSQGTNIFPNNVGNGMVLPTNKSCHTTPKVAPPHGAQQSGTQRDILPSQVSCNIGDYHRLAQELHKSMRNEETGETCTSHDEKLSRAVKSYNARRVLFLKECLVQAGFEACEVDNPQVLQRLENKIQEEESLGKDI